MMHASDLQILCISGLHRRMFHPIFLVLCFAMSRNGNLMLRSLSLIRGDGFGICFLHFAELIPRQVV